MEADNWIELGAIGLTAALAVRGGELIAGGSFSLPGETGAVTIARWNGSQWLAWPGGPPGTNTIRSIAASDGNIYVGGNNGTVSKWQSGVWSQLPLPRGGTHFLAASKTRVFAGTKTISGMLVLEEWNGTNWSFMFSCCLTCEPPPCWEFNTLTMSGNDLYAGGRALVDFGHAYPDTTDGILKWDGARWSGILFGEGTARALASNGSELFVGGNFGNAGGKAAHNFTIWHIPQRLEIVRTTNQITISWPGTGTNFLLEASGNLEQTNWSEVSQPAVLHDEKCVVTESLTGTNRFYRLRRKAW